MPGMVCALSPCMMAIPQAGGAAPSTAATPKQNTKSTEMDSQMLMAFLGQRRALVSELEHLQERRAQIVMELQSPGAKSAELRREAAEVERGITDANTAIRAVNRAIAGRSGAVAGGGGGGGANDVGAVDAMDGSADPMSQGGTMQPMSPMDAPSGLAGNAVYVAGGGILLVIVLGIASLAMVARRLRRQAAEGVALLRSDMNEQIGKVASGFDAIAVEIERIGEGQRYVTKLLSEAPLAVELLPKAKEADPVQRL